MIKIGFWIFCVVVLGKLIHELVKARRRTVGTYYREWDELKNPQNFPHAFEEGEYLECNICGLDEWEEVHLAYDAELERLHEDDMEDSGRS